MEQMKRMGLRPDQAWSLSRRVPLMRVDFVLTRFFRRHQFDQAFSLSLSTTGGSKPPLLTAFRGKTHTTQVNDVRSDVDKVSVSLEPSGVVGCRGSAEAHA